MTEILKEIVIAIGKFFLNPLVYVTLMVAIFLGYRRVKRERKFFHRRILWGWSEFHNVLKDGLLLSLVISILTVALGLTVPLQFLYLLTIVSIVSLILYSFHLLSPGVLLSISFFVYWLMGQNDWNFSFIQIENDYEINEIAITVTLIMGLLLIAEGLLIQKRGATFASPIIEISKRGKKAIAYFSKKVWLLPIFLVIPGDTFNAYSPWWPQFTLGSEQFSIILFPIVIGFQQLTRRLLPVYFYHKLGKIVLGLGSIVLIGGVIGIFQPIIAIGTIVIACVARIGISAIFAFREKKDVYAVSAKSQGVTIAAVLPDSPAMKMGLLPGEVIRKVNGVEVHNENELYEALQINAAHCKLEVLNYNQEVRLTQHVVYSNDHFQIGLLLAES